MAKYGLTSKGAIAIHELILKGSAFTKYVRDCWTNNGRDQLLADWADLDTANQEDKTKGHFTPDLAKFRTVLRRVTTEGNNPNMQIKLDEKTGNYSFYEAKTRNTSPKKAPASTKQVSFSAKNKAPTTLTEARAEFAHFLKGMEREQVIDQLRQVVKQIEMTGIKISK